MGRVDEKRFCLYAEFYGKGGQVASVPRRAGFPEVRQHQDSPQRG
jgi:hypothetical protein